MTKRRRASELIFKTSHGFGPRGRLPIVIAAAGTGTLAAVGILTVVAGAVATSCYLTFSSGTNIGTLVGTGIGA